MAVKDIYFHNTLTSKKDLFKPVLDGKVGIYSCGPTVYNRVHIGNIRAFVFPDIVKRFLQWRGFNVALVRNITDVDDKTIKKSQEDNLTLKEFTEKYTALFFDDLKKLNIEDATYSPRATDNIKEMVEIIKKLISNGLAYEAKDGIYFAISKSKNYGALAGLHIDTSKLESRIANDEYDKESPQDFALWKFWTPEDGEVFWDTELGKGRPGWHIECSAMSVKYLGQPFDIHTGGIDLIFPHHTNEIAQSEGSCDGQHLANYFIHNGHVLIDSAKMAKSAGNFITLEELIEKGFFPLSYRYWLLTAHYKTLVNFTWETLAASEQAMKKIVRTLSTINDDGNVNSAYIDKFDEAMSDDLNTPKAIALIWDILKDDALIAADKKTTILEIDKVLGLNILGQISEETVQAPEEVQDLAKQRKTARDQGNWTESDNLRQKITDLGWKISDTPEGFTLSPL